MINNLKVWITNICVAVFFITAVEMILPNNSIKKYAKFVLGLILIVVIIDPLMKIYDKNFDFYSYSNKALSYIDSDSYGKDNEKYKVNNISNTTENFKKNLENQCVKNLQEKYPENNYNVDINIDYDQEKQTFNINKVEIGVANYGVKTVKNIQINTKSVDATKKNVLQDEQGNKIKKFISDEFQISKDIITVYKVNS